jgi:hypothetical protein
MSGGHGHIEGSNKKIALLVAILAAALAFSETGGKSAQTQALGDNIEASNLWQFFQAKTIRQTVMRTYADAVEAEFKDNPQSIPVALKAQAERWRATAQRYETEADTQEGRRELMARAKAKEQSRDKALAAYHLFEYGSAAFQLAIVLAGASALTAVVWLTYLSIGLGVIGTAFTAFGFFAPTLIHI